MKIWCFIEAPFSRLRVLRFRNINSHYRFYLFGSNNDNFVSRGLKCLFSSLVCMKNIASVGIKKTPDSERTAERNFRDFIGLGIFHGSQVQDLQLWCSQHKHRPFDPCGQSTRLLIKLARVNYHQKIDFFFPREGADVNRLH